MATYGHYRTTSVTAERPSCSSKRFSLASLASIDTVGSYSGSRISTETPIVVTTTVATTTRTFAAPALPPFAPSLGSDDPLPCPRRGAPPIAPAPAPEEQARKGGVLRKIRRALGFERKVLDPALCEGWN
ncbi:hypothetical protein B0H17DRAFT_1140628 [Mycena rosella]|uniref:Uncharacterized protein n=1 Tax=Mycena rosella TaxID=1033263 RepID=A0AAD7D1Y0_MYCRO|nr:hypothetical protein B0H17DRAFT_1140628 [Mycena rosella]